VSGFRLEPDTQIRAEGLYLSGFSSPVSGLSSSQNNVGATLTAYPVCGVEGPEGDSRVEAIAGVACPPRPAQGDRAHPEGASEAELRKRTLTNLYNARPAWMANAHAVLDRAVFAAYKVGRRRSRTRASSRRASLRSTWRGARASGPQTPQTTRNHPVPPPG
jgi:hypothetical protein